MTAREFQRATVARTMPLEIERDEPGAGRTVLPARPPNAAGEIRLKLDAQVFAIDAGDVSRRIERFIAEAMTTLRRDGVVVPISGGLDSSTVVTLATRAVGAGRVTGLMMPEKQGNPEAARYGAMIAGRLGIATKTVDLSPLLAKAGTYDFVLSRIPGRAVREKAVKGYFALARRNPYLQGIRGERPPLFGKGFATMNSKHRMRLAMEYRFAEEKNLLVVGCAHRSEDLVGLFVKYGVDDCADVMPLKNLYRSHILQVARHVGVPGEIIGRPPNPDIIPGVTDKYFDVLGIPSETVDLILFGLVEAKMTCEEVAKELGLPPGQAEEVQEIVELTAHMRTHSMAPDLPL